MTGLARALTALLRRSAALLPADRRDWAEAVCAEASEVPPGERLGWLAGGLWLVVRETRMLRTIGCSLAFGAAAAAVVWSAWPGSSANRATLINRVDVIAIVVMLAALPWVIRRSFGPAGDSRTAWVMRAGGYAVILVLVLAKARVERLANSQSGLATPGLMLWIGEIIFLVVIAAYAAGLLAVTARRPPAAPAALAPGLWAGVAVGLAMYALTPLATQLHTANAWQYTVFGGALALVWIVMLCAPTVAGLAAGWRLSAPLGHGTLADARARQGLAAGLCAAAAGSLLGVTLGTCALALLPHEPRLFYWAYPLQHLAGGALHTQELNLSGGAAWYLIILLFCPLLGAGFGAWGGLYTASHTPWRPGGGRPGGGGSPAPEPPRPAGGQRLPERVSAGVS